MRTDARRRRRACGADRGAAAGSARRRRRLIGQGGERRAAQGGRRLAALAREQRRRQPRLGAARRAQLRQLLPRLPLAEVRALVAPGRRTWTIPPDLLQQVPAAARATRPRDYILTSMPAADAADWFGKTPPDLSLMARARGRDYLYQFLKTFYVDPTRQTGANNLRLPTTAMPHVLSRARGPEDARCSRTRHAGRGRPGRARAGVRPLRAGRARAA